jgi:SAM-dependent methyltransferase
MIRTIKNLARHCFPTIYRRLYEQKYEASDYGRLCAELLRISGGKVAHGPFEGMKYLNVASGYRLAHKIVGSYEQEIHPWIERIIAFEPRLVLDVGCADGYFVTGLAYRLPHAKVIGFDIESIARTICQQQVTANRLADRVEIREACTAETLSQMDLRSAVIIVDCEGYERELLDPSKAPTLADAVILVELHDAIIPQTKELIAHRLSNTHEIEIVQQTPRKSSDYPILASLEPSRQELAIYEDRYVGEIKVFNQEWALCWPKKTKD